MQLVGGTPLAALDTYCKRRNLRGKIFAKLENKNMAGSVKDRIALAMIEDAERRGALKEGGRIVEPSSGNTGVALAAIGRKRGYHVRIYMPENMSEARKKLIRAYGAELILTPAAEGMAGAISRAEQEGEEGAFLPRQFSNPANPAAHYRTTGPEIFAAIFPHALVAGVGTGGTLTGAGRFLKEKDPNIRILAVEPAGSPVLSGGRAGRHKIQGIGAGFLPDVLDTKIFDEVADVSDEEAFEAQRDALEEGLLIGISSGAALCAAAELAKREEFAGKNIVAIFPDGGERYL